MGWTKSARGNLSLPVITIIICTIGVISLFYVNKISTYHSVLKFKPCSNCTFAKSKNSHTDVKRLEINPLNEYDGYECNNTDGNWVFNTSIKPLYTDRTCSYIDREYACVKNGRNDSDYLYWEWQPDHCVLPRFDPEIALLKLQGKRLMFVGDSLQKNQWQSFVCLVESIIPEDQKSMKKISRGHSVFKVEEYNASIEFYWAPFLVESNTDFHIKFNPNQKIVKVDSITQRAQNWLGADILVFNTYVWWMGRLKINTLWGEFQNGEEGYEELDTPVSYRLALRTWANWIDSTIDSNKTRIFFTTMSPSHERPQILLSRPRVRVGFSKNNALLEDPTLVRQHFEESVQHRNQLLMFELGNKDWGNINGIMCYNETRPVMKKGHWGFGSNKEMMKVVASVIKRMKVHVTVLNITQLSEYRIDAHSSIYGESYGKLLTNEQKTDPLHFADCIHWCLPGVPDTWNRLLYVYL